MKSLSVPLFLLMASTATLAQEHPQVSISPDDGAAERALRSSPWYEMVTHSLRQSEYDFLTVEGEPGVWSAPNRPHELRSRISAKGLEIFPREAGKDASEAAWRLRLRTASYGRIGSINDISVSDVLTHGHRAELDHGLLTEWFENRAEGVEQGWTIASRPEGRGSLRIGIEIGGGFEFKLEPGARDGALVRGDVEVPYRGLVAFDARGELLPARMEPSSTGLVIVVDDSAASYPVVVDPVLSGPAWSTEANQADAWYGSSVAIVGDVNGDGYDDIVVGAPFFDAGELNEGRAWLFHGSANGPSLGSNWFASSDQAGSFFGDVVAPAGDVNGDGFDDLMVSAPFFDSGQLDEGAVWVYHGSSSGLSTGSNWFLDGDQTEARMGLAMGTAGDVNQDGFDDVLVAAPYYDAGETDEGRAWVFHGSSTGLSNSSNWFASSNQAGSLFGYEVSAAGDVDNDGFDDILVAAPLFDAPEANEGRVWRYDGSPSGLPTGSSWFVESDQAGCQFGLGLASAGDVNGDGFDDVLIGAPFFNGGVDNEGRAWLFHGGTTNPTGSAWFREGNQVGARYGAAVAGAGDVNGDGFDDVLVAAPNYDAGQDDEGLAWLHLGSPLGLIDDPSWSAQGDQDFAWFGQALGGAGDVNGDGLSDIVIGAPGYDGGELNEGRVCAYTGSANPGVPYCLSTLNSTGAPALISASGSPSATAGSLQLEAGPVPAGVGLFIHAPNQTQVPFGNGFLCVSGAVVRGDVVPISTDVMQYTYNNSTPPSSLGGFAGSTRRFQAWFRDPAGGGSNFDLSDATAIVIHP